MTLEEIHVGGLAVRYREVSAYLDVSITGGL